MDTTTKGAAPQYDGSIQVLHIEDDSRVAVAVARLLLLQGYDIISAASADEAIQVIEDGLVPDLILTDYHLPGEITGDRVIAQIEARLGFRPPTIMLASVPDLRAEEMQSIANRIFVKPADMDIVLREMGRLLDIRARAG